MDFAPIFVHSLFRAGSTYIFGAFRRSPAGYWCYQEPLHEYIRHVADAPERLLEVDFHLGSALRHPDLQKPYFWEFYEIKDAIGALFRKDLSYDSFFAQEREPLFESVATYLDALLRHARGRPMLQCCRSFGRAAALRRRFGGKHIHLWRNPWDQWWSYQVDLYFEATNQLILNATDLPPVLRCVKQQCSISDFHDSNIEIEIVHASSHRLHARHAYFAFYSLWLYALMETERIADVSVNIDMLSSSATYRDRTLATLADAGIAGVDFSDCHIAQAGFGSADRTFFENVENGVHALFEAQGYDATDLASALRCRAERLPSARRTSEQLIEDAARARQVALTQNDRLADAQRTLEANVVALNRSQKFALEETARSRECLQQRVDEISLLSERLAGLTLELDAAVTLAEIRQQEIQDITGELALRNDEIASATTNARLQQQALLSTRDYAANLENEISAARSRVDEVHREMTRWSNVATDTYNHLQAVYATRSWRVTAPLRWIKRSVRLSRLASNGSLTGFMQRAQNSAGRLVAHTARYLHTRPALKRMLIRVLSRFPRYYQKIRSIAFSHAVQHPVAPVALDSHPIQEGSNPAGTHDSSDLDRCSPAVVRIYRLLISAHDAPAPPAMGSSRGMSPN
jgi:hypothetical protein